MSDQAIMDKLKKFTVKDLREAVGQKNKKYKNANPYTGYSTARKEDLIKMIMANKNDFKDMVKIKEPITVESIKKKEEKKAVKKSVVKQETKKAEPVKKPVTKTAKKGDVQGVTSKKTIVDQILDIIKNAPKQPKNKKNFFYGSNLHSQEITNFIIEVFYEELSQLVQSNKQLRTKYMNQKNDKFKLAIYEPKNLMNILENNKSLVNTINTDSEIENSQGVSLKNFLQKLNLKKKESITKATKNESNGKIEDKYNDFEEQYGDIEDEEFEENKAEFEELFKNIVEYFNKNKSKMNKGEIKSFKSLIKNIKDKKNE